jgi:hypothetical protein
MLAIRDRIRPDDGALTLRFAGERHTTADWTLGGIRIERPRCPMSVDDRITGQIQGLGHAGPFEAWVGAVDDDGTVSLRFDVVPLDMFMEMARLRGA